MTVRPTPRRKKAPLTLAQRLGRGILETPPGITGLGPAGAEIRRFGLQLTRRNAVLEKARKGKKATSKK